MWFYLFRKSFFFLKRRFLKRRSCRHRRGPFLRLPPPPRQHLPSTGSARVAVGLALGEDFRTTCLLPFSSSSSPLPNNNNNNSADRILLVDSDTLPTPDEIIDGHDTSFPVDEKAKSKKKKKKKKPFFIEATYSVDAQGNATGEAAKKADEDEKYVVETLEEEEEEIDDEEANKDEDSWLIEREEVSSGGGGGGGGVGGE